MSEHLILRHRDIPNLDQLEVYRQHGGFEAFKKAVTTMESQQVVD
jgi:NADH-quinone oxidoreductase subunit F